VSFKVFAIFGMVLICAGCASRHCRVTPGAPQTKASDADLPLKDSTSRRAKVFKYDGSLQCGRGKAISLDAAAAELKGVSVFSKVKRVDGLMHIQVCGAPTGMANVFEILETDLGQAEKLGFKKWTFE
jgi:hypothetical protein